MVAAGKLRLVYKEKSVLTTETQRTQRKNKSEKNRIRKPD
jgi:hypothetical protein